MFKRTCMAATALALAACTHSPAAAEPVQYVATEKDYNSVLYPNNGRAVIMNGRDYDALLIAYCQLQHGLEHVKAAGCVLQLRKAFPIRGLGYATESSEAITAETT